MTLHFTDFDKRMISMSIQKDGDCHIWRGSYRARYPAYTHKGKSYNLRRCMLENHLGEKLPDDRKVKNTCKNMNCINPDHLELVTQRTKNRYHLTRAEVRAIREACQHANDVQVAEKFNRSRSCIQAIRTNKVWRNV